MGEPELDVVGRDMDRGCRYFCIWYGAGILGRAMGTASGPDDVQVEKQHESSRILRKSSQKNSSCVRRGMWLRHSHSLRRVFLWRSISHGLMRHKFHPTNPPP